MKVLRQFPRKRWEKRQYATIMIESIAQRSVNVQITLCYAMLSRVFQFTRNSLHVMSVSQYISQCISVSLSE